MYENRNFKMLKDDILNYFEFQQRCCCHIVITTDVKQWDKRSVVTGQTVHEHIVADALFSKKRLLVLLVHEERASHKCSLSSCHPTAFPE